MIECVRIIVLCLHIGQHILLDFAITCNLCCHVFLCVCGSIYVCRSPSLMAGIAVCCMHGSNGHFGPRGCVEWLVSLVNCSYMQLLKVDLSVLLGVEGALPLQDVYKRVI